LINLKFLNNFFISSLSFLKRDFANNVSYKMQFILSIISIFLSVYVFFFFSKLFQGENSYLNDYGGDYFFFLIIGICIMDMIFKVSITLNLEIRNYQLTGIFDELINMPTPIIITLLNSHIYPIIFSLFRSLIYFLVAIVFFDLNISLNQPFFLIATVILTIACYLGIGIISGSYTILFKTGNPLSNLNRVSVLVAGGVFFPTTILPDWLENISFLIPITHSLDLIRALLMPDFVPLDNMYEKLFLLLSFATFLIFSGVFLCNKAINLGRKKGTLNFY